MRSRLLLSLCGAALACATLLVAAPQAKAQMPYAGVYGYPYPAYGYNVIVNDRRLPYFAEFPPVYYSQPVARTYGYSPWAYPPTVMTPDPQVKPEPKLMVNPYVTPKQDAKETANTKGKVTQTGPRVLVNPYLATNEAALVAIEAKATGSPQVIHPVAETR